jgi:hypothetical protein
MALGGALGEKFGVPTIFVLGTFSAVISLVLAWWLKRL